MAQLVSGKASQKEVALRLEVSVCPAKRLKQSYVETGVSGLISKKRGQPSNRRIAQDVLAQAVRLIGTHYADFGPTIAAEKLREQHGVPLSVEAVRKLIMEHGHWKVRRTRTARVHQMLDRRGQRGELIQIDGSPHDWFEGRSPRCCLLVFIDDATGELMHLQFVDAETTLGYMAALEQSIIFSCTACPPPCTATGTAYFASTRRSRSARPEPVCPGAGATWHRRHPGQQSPGERAGQTGQPNVAGPSV